MQAWAVTRHNAPLERIELPTPEPAGTEVLVEVTACGVCHSDLYFWGGSYDMGGGKRMTLADRGVTLPMVPGHEVVGRVIRCGPEASGVSVGDLRIVYPWIGCGACMRCAAGEDNLCGNPRFIGVKASGGFGEHVLVPHPKYLVDFSGVDPAWAATFACSGLTVRSAIRKVMPLPPRMPILLMGAGGLGLAAIAMLKAYGHEAIIAVDLSPESRQAALTLGAQAALDGRDPNIGRLITEAAGAPILAAIDFVAIPDTARVASDALAKGGKLVLVGVYGGELPLSLAGMIFKAQTIEGNYCGSLQDLRDVVELARSGRLAPIPITRLAPHDANEAITRLHEGRVTGRLVLERGA